MKVLVADDDFANRQFLEKFFSSYAKVVAVDNGMSAVDEVAKALNEQESFDLICLDIMMPKLDGYKTLAAIRWAEDKYKVLEKNKVKVLMLSALDEDVHDQICICDDYDAYICKPILVDVLEEQLTQLGFTR